MKQLLQSLKTGAIEIAEVPCPAVRHGHVLSRTSRTLVSVGTERMLLEFGKAGWLQKARQQPDKVQMVLQKARVDGFLPTINAVFNKLEQPLSIGYCNVGYIIDVGADVAKFATGDRIVSNGKHAEFVCTPINLCAKVPDNVSDDEAAFTVLGAIALQGIRLAQPTLGEAVVVTGLGLVGLLAVQLLRAYGCRVLAIDFDVDKLTLAQSFGAEVVNLSANEDPVSHSQKFSRNQGVDAVIITAATTSNEPVHQAAKMCRKRGRIVLVGVAGLALSRADFYEKELTFQVSCSYGPGRYDTNYEEKGIDYPIGFVRWTEQRNFEAILDLMADHRLNVKPLISSRFEITEAQKAYDLISSSNRTLGILLNYPDSTPLPPRRTVDLVTVHENRGIQRSDKKTTVSFIGAGNYSSAILIPAFKAAGACFQSIASASGVSGIHLGRKYKFKAATTDTFEIFADSSTSTVVIATRHDSHAKFVLDALRAQKHVFVEKPLCLTHDELNQIKAAYLSARTDSGNSPILMVGFNRRFAPQIRKMKSLLLSTPGPKAFVMTVNAGAIDASHWTQDPQIGGGRILGEACHFVDLLRFLAGTNITEWSRSDMTTGRNDNTTLQLKFADGSVGSIHYFSNGSKTFPKERLEVFAEGRILQLINFRHLYGFGWPGFTKMNIWRQDKGQHACAKAFTDAIEGNFSSPIPFDEIFEVSLISIDLARRQ